MEPMLRRTIGEHIDLRCWVASELPPTVIDPSQVTQLLMNLTVNARDAMPDGGRLTIQATEFENGVRLIVEDTGAGMSEDTVAKAFDPFFTTKPPGSGTGLGLATVYGIVSQAGGTVSLDSEPGRGTRATIDLPAREPLYPPTPPRSEHAGRLERQHDLPDVAALVHVPVRGGAVVEPELLRHDRPQAAVLDPAAERLDQVVERLRARPRA